VKTCSFGVPFPVLLNHRGNGIADHSLGVSQPARKIYYSICALELALIWFGGDGETL
jgi:hypothetical protein